MCIKLIFLASLILASTEAVKLETFLKADHKPFLNDLREAIDYIIDNFYFEHHITTIVVAAVKNQHDEDVMDLKNGIISEVDMPNPTNHIFCLFNNSNIRPMRRFNREAMVILVDTYESFRDFEKFLTPDRFSLQGHWIFVLVNGVFDDKTMSDMIYTLWQRGVIHFYIMFEKDSYIHYTSFRPFTPEKCSDTRLVYRFVFRDGEFQNGTKPKVLFPKDKFMNLYGCPLRVVTFERCPAMCYSKRKRFSGYDYELIRAIGIYLNFSLDLQYLPGAEKWGTILPNGSTTGALDVLRKEEAEIGIGNYFLRLSRLALFDSTVSYLSVPIVLVIPPPSPITPFEKLLQPFDRFVWMLIIIILGIGIIVILIIDWKLKKVRNFVFGRRVHAPMMNFVAAILGLQQQVLPSRNFARFILMVFLLFCLVNRSLYQGALYIFLQADGLHEEIASVDEMINLNFNYYIHGSYVDFVDEKSPIFKRKIIVKSEEDLPFSRKVDDTLKAAFMTPLTNVIDRNEEAKGHFALIVCKEIVSVLQIVMYMRKDFFLKETFNELLLNFDSNGLLSYWYSKNAQKKYLKFIEEGNPGAKQLNFRSLFGVFNIMLIGYGVGLVVLVLENVIFRWKKLKAIKRDKINKVKLRKRPQRAVLMTNVK